jgi:hypothetical protein
MQRETAESSPESPQQLMKLPVELHVYMARLYGQLNMRESLFLLASTCKSMRNVYLPVLYDCRLTMSEQVCMNALVSSSLVEIPRNIAFQGYYPEMLYMNQFVNHVARQVTKLEFKDATFPLSNVFLVVNMLNSMTNLESLKVEYTGQDMPSTQVLLRAVADALPRFPRLNRIEISVIDMPFELSNAVNMLPPSVAIFV